MKIVVELPVFNPELQGKAVYVYGYDVDGDRIQGFHLVKKVQGDCVTLLNVWGNEFDVHLESMATDEDDSGLVFEVFENKEELNNDN